MDIHERISFVMNRENLSAKEFSEILGVQRSSISHLVSGRNKPSIDFLHRFIENFSKYNIVWLITGSGEALQTNPNVKLDVSTGNDGKSGTKIIQHTLFEQDDNEVINSVKDEKSITSETKNKETEIEHKKVEHTENNTVTNVNLSIKKEKIIERIIIFYNDGTFDSYSENKKND